MSEFKLQSVTNHSFFETAALTWVFTVDVAADADTVWQGLTSSTPLSWCRKLKGSYTTPQPYTVGTQRKVRVAGLLQMNEEFFYWNDSERRHSFFATHANIPFFQSFAEDYHVTEIEGGARLSWRFAIQPRPGFVLFMKSGRMLNEMIFSSFMKDTLNHFGPVQHSGI